MDEKEAEARPLMGTIFLVRTMYTNIMYIVHEQGVFRICNTIARF